MVGGGSLPLSTVMGVILALKGLCFLITRAQVCIRKLRIIKISNNNSKNKLMTMIKTIMKKNNNNKTTKYKL